MNVALIGATGLVGSKILFEAVRRGHSVTGICRRPENVMKNGRVRAVGVDATDTPSLTHQLHGHDAVIHAYSPHRDPDVDEYMQDSRARGTFSVMLLAHYQPADPARHDATVRSRIDAQTTTTKSIIAAAKAAGVKRVLAVGGAGALLVNGVPGMDLPTFPKAFEGGAKSTAVVTELLKHESDLEWTVLCPPTSIAPGERTGKFRLGLDDLLTQPDGSSSISLEDYAMAMVDELESPRHTWKRFTVGY